MSANLQGEGREEIICNSTHELLSDANGYIIENNQVVVRNKISNELFYMPIDETITEIFGFGVVETIIDQNNLTKSIPIATNNSNSEKFLKWSRNDILNLISLYEEHQKEFQSSCIKNEKVWQQIAMKMKKFTTKQCSDKFKYLKQRYVRKKDNMGTTESGAEYYKFEYFDEFDKIFGKKPNIKPITIASSSRGDTDAKRIIGRKLEDHMIKTSLQPFHQNFELMETENGMAAFKLNIAAETVLKKPEEVSAEVLKYLMKYASEYLGENVEEAVVSVPAYFSGAQRKATLKAAELAGLRVLRLISEPVAGALHYVTDKNIKEKIMVIDFGGGTLDVSLIEVNDKKFEVKAVAGDALLGGRNIDNNLFKHFYVPPKHCLDKKVLRILRRLEENCILIKEYLSETETYTKVIDDYHGDSTDLTLTLDRTQFEALNEKIFRRTIDIVKYCLRSANWVKEDVGKVILVGGSTRIPRIRELLGIFFGDSKIKTDLNPDEAVARGACLEAAILCRGFEGFETYKINEVNCLSLGLAAYGNLTNFVIPKNTRLPTEGRVSWVTIKNDQKTMNFRITEGERKNSVFNNELGTFAIEDLPQKIAGDVKFTVKFKLNEDGILTVEATENSTGKNNSLTVTMGEFRLSEYEINFNIEEAEKQMEEDDNFEKFILRRNELIGKCNRWTYNNKDEVACRRYERFIWYAENLNFHFINELNEEFSKLTDDI